LDLIRSNFRAWLDVFVRAVRVSIGARITPLDFLFRSSRKVGIRRNRLFRVQDKIEET
jgi:hypothetical protein